MMGAPRGLIHAALRWQEPRVHGAAATIRHAAWQRPTPSFRWCQRDLGEADVGARFASG